MSKDEVKSGGVGFLGLLGLLFIGLKLTGYIDWSWLWVLSPLWLPWVAIIISMFIGITIASLILFFEKK